MTAKEAMKRSNDNAARRYQHRTAWIVKGDLGFRRVLETDKDGDMLFAPLSKEEIESHDDWHPLNDEPCRPVSRRRSNVSV